MMLVKTITSKGFIRIRYNTTNNYSFEDKMITFTRELTDLFTSYFDDRYEVLFMRKEEGFIEITLKYPSLLADKLNIKGD